MKKFLVAVLLFTTFAGTAFAAKKAKQPHVKYDYRYHTPKYKVPKSHNHPHNTHKT